ncbi:MAG: hypothetical protein OEM29_07070 [Thermoplasmata archaeon]|nr:hypothetical protein [Thermoplasmata archaeon]
MKCKRCYTKIPAAVLERVCPECGWRTPSLFMLLVQAVAVTSLCALILIRYLIEMDLFDLYFALLLGATTVFAWAHYVVVRERRRGLGYSD